MSYFYVATLMLDHECSIVVGQFSVTPLVPPFIVVDFFVDLEVFFFFKLIHLLRVALVKNVEAWLYECSLNIGNVIGF